MSTLTAARPWWRHPALWVALFAIVTTFAFIELRGIWDPDEGRYTNVALNMVDSGDWLIPRRSYEVEHWTKPPLTYWAIASSVVAFGTNAFAARVPSALSHLLCVLLVGLMGRRLAPGNGPRAALTYAAMLFPFGASQMITTDYLLTATETLALWAFVEARFGPSHPKRWLVLMWAGFGLAFLTKGPPGLLPLLPILLFDVLTGTPGRPGIFRPLGLLVFVAIAAPWYIAVTQKTPGLLGYFLGSEVVGRVATDEFKRHGEWYGWFVIYAPTLVIGTLPWSRSLWRWMRGLAAQVREWRSGVAARIAGANWLLPTLWALVPLLIFCIARSRLPLYILPLFAPLALLVTLQSLKDGRAMPRPAAIVLWGAAMIALKIASAHFPTHKDARDWARAIRERTSDPIEEVLFVEDMARYGVHLHLGPRVQIEKLSLQDVPEARFNPEHDESLDGELAEHEPEQLWVCKQDNAATVFAHVRAAGFEPVVLGTPYQGRLFFRTVPVTRPPVVATPPAR
ncbi:phospholipid carrier-dependent glycosyltransferase [Lysobacter sp. TY2-98]|uniref:ArnT family glycosyltransferase n=1 Tax=Lysobacter sp. TY2-98 TaxID=2290922 RepID=UPI000E200DFD|nr:glycosyltransferase family 39 protein [Lysobacter sp. TY2-98]AXK73158.1 phospholipid carrier-dependent glycosyltransferase [Lysobacter sp. TY2-98]